MRVLLIKDEWYPVYAPVDEGKHYDIALDVPEATAARWKAGVAAFKELQGEMRREVEARREQVKMGAP